MKNFTLLLIVSLFTLFSASSQSTYKNWRKQEKKDSVSYKKELKKVAKEYAKFIYEDAKELKKKRNEWVKTKADKRAKKKKDMLAENMKTFKKDRYKVIEGLPSLEEQTEKEINMAYEYNPITLFPANIEGQAKCIAKTYKMAVGNARTMAKDNLANEIVHEIMIQFALRDFVKHFGLDMAQDITSAILETRESLSDKLETVQNVMEIYNSRNYLNTEVIVRIFCSEAEAKANFKRVLYSTLSDNTALYNEIVTYLESDMSKKN